MSAEQVSATLADVDALLRKYVTNRAALRRFLDNAEEPYLKHLSYDDVTEQLVAGSLTYAEGLNDFIAFLAVMRGAGSFLAPADEGVAIIHNYTWDDEEELRTLAAVHIGPGNTSRFFSEEDRRTAGSLFAPLAAAMRASWDAGAGAEPDELATLA